MSDYIVTIGKECDSSSDESEFVHIFKADDCYFGLYGGWEPSKLIGNDHTAIIIGEADFVFVRYDLHQPLIISSDEFQDYCIIDKGRPYYIASEDQKRVRIRKSSCLLVNRALP